MPLTAPRRYLRPLVRAAAMTVPLLGLTMTATGAKADSAPSAELKALAATVTDMGYTPKYAPNGGHFYVQGADVNGDTVDFSMSDSKTFVWVYSQVITYTATQMDHLPALKLLQANDTSPEFFSINTDGGTSSLYVQIAMPIQAVSAQTLRKVIDGIASMVNDNAALWNPKLWKDRIPVAAVGPDHAVQGNGHAKLPRL